MIEENTELALLSKSQLTSNSHHHDPDNLNEDTVTVSYESTGKGSQEVATGSDT
jgi:hypothetical protein